MTRTLALVAMMWGCGPDSPARDSGTAETTPTTGTATGTTTANTDGGSVADPRLASAAWFWWEAEEGVPTDSMVMMLSSGDNVCAGLIAVGRAPTPEAAAEAWNQHFDGQTWMFQVVMKPGTPEPGTEVLFTDYYATYGQGEGQVSGYQTQQALGSEFFSGTDQSAVVSYLGSSGTFQFTAFREDELEGTLDLVAGPVAGGDPAQFAGDVRAPNCSDYMAVMAGW